MGFCQNCGRKTKKRCGRCGVAFYCSLECQQEDHERHKDECSPNWKFFKERATRKYNDGKFASSLRSFYRSLAALPPLLSCTLEGMNIRNNIAMCHLKSENFRESLSVLSEVLRRSRMSAPVDSPFVFSVSVEYALPCFKAFTRRSRVLKLLGNSSAAIQDAFLAASIPGIDRDTKAIAKQTVSELMKSSLEEPGVGINGMKPVAGGDVMACMKPWTRQGLVVEGRCRTIFVETSATKDVPLPIFAQTLVNMGNDEVVLFGGDITLCGGNPQNDTFFLEGSKKDYLWRNIGSPKGKRLSVIPPPRSMHTSCVHADRMLVYGGFASLRTESSSGRGGSGNSPPLWSEASSTMWALSLKGKRWAKLDCKGSVPEKQLYGHSSVVVADKMFIFGGRALDEDMESNALYSVDLSKPNPEFELLSGGFHSISKYQSTPRITSSSSSSSSSTSTSSSSTSLSSSRVHPSPRHLCGMWASRKKLFIFGGCCNRGDTEFSFGDFWCYDLFTHSWSEIQMRGNFPCARSEFAYAGNKSFFYLHGGYSSRIWSILSSSGDVMKGSYLRDTFQFDVEKEMWSIVAMENPTVCRSRAGAAMTCLSGGKIVIVGGYHGGVDAKGSFICADAVEVELKHPEETPQEIKG